MNDTSLICDDCNAGGLPQTLRVFNGDKASWMSTGGLEGIWFCPQCGQVYVQWEVNSEIKRMTIDEYEYHGN